MGKQSLCMMQYYKILCGCRIPGKKKDTWVCYPPDEANPPRHLVIAHNNAVSSVTDLRNLCNSWMQFSYHGWLPLHYYSENLCCHGDRLKSCFRWSFSDFSESLPMTYEKNYVLKKIKSSTRQCIYELFIQILGVVFSVLFLGVLWQWQPAPGHWTNLWTAQEYREPVKWTRCSSWSSDHREQKQVG